MTSATAVKFSGVNADPQGRPLHWHRAGLDHLPFRGTPPLLREAEMEENLVTTSDIKNGTFFVGDVEQNARYLELLEKVANGWYQIIYIDRYRKPDDTYYTVYIEWAERYLENGQPAPAFPSRS